jgi:cytochrome c-type biogenesis protein CcmE
MAVSVDRSTLDPGPDGEGDTTPAVDSQFDATPRTRPPRRRRAVVVTVGLVVVIALLIVIAVKSLGEASLFFLNADEAVAQQDELGSDRFRLQGTVVSGSVDENDAGVRFQVVFDDVIVNVAHQGDPPELFQPEIPVVLEGQWDGDTFASDRILVRHSSEYEADNGERLDEADDQLSPSR